MISLAPFHLPCGSCHFVWTAVCYGAFSMWSCWQRHLTCWSSKLIIASANHAPDNFAIRWYKKLLLSLRYVYVCIDQCIPVQKIKLKRIHLGGSINYLSLIHLWSALKISFPENLQIRHSVVASSCTVNTLPQCSMFRHHIIWQFRIVQMCSACVHRLYS